MHVLGVMVLSAVALLAALSWVIAPAEARTLDFYSTSAQIIPVTLLVLVLEARHFGLVGFTSGESASPRLGLVGTALSTLVTTVVLVGEYNALAVLATGKLTSGDPRWVFAAVTAGFAALLAVPLYAARRG